jgi:BirA family transcriptional regulator, biotin operon repressor / biotin---[acetyl-CoA-carboxylase] ligase
MHGSCPEGRNPWKIVSLMFKFYHYKTLTSTNDKAKELLRKGIGKAVIVAHRQTRGRGRFSRQWLSSPGGLYLTILLKEKNLDKAGYLTFISAVCVAKTVIEVSKLDAKVKWPNDVMVNGKKICGILTETISGKESYALVGIGLNVNQEKFPKEIADISTSLKIKANKTYNLNKILKLITKEFDTIYTTDYTKKDYHEIMKLWKKYSDTLGRKIKAKTLSGTFIGKAVGIDKDCNLMLRLGNGKTKKIIEGDIFNI